MQALMWRAITWPTGAADFLAKADAKTRADFEACFLGGEEFSAVERMEVYANAYYWRLHGVMEENFPVLAWLVGRDRFRNLLTDFFLAHPSADPDLRHLGDALPDYLDATDHRTWAEIARVESIMGRVLHAPDHPACTLQDLVSIEPAKWPSLRLELHPTLHRMSCSVDYAQLAERRSQGEVPPSRTPMAPTGPLLLWRQGFRVKRRRASATEGMALEAFAENADFQGVCAHLTANGVASINLPQLATQLSTWLRTWVDSGLLARVSVDPPLAES